MRLGILVELIHGVKGVSEEENVECFSKALNDYLLIKNTSIDDETPYGTTLLIQAVRTGRKEIVEILLSKNAHFNSNIFLFLKQKKVFDSIIYVLNRKTKSEKQDFLNDAFSKLLYPQSKPILEWLVHEGAWVDHKNMFGQTALMHMVFQGKFKVTRFLVEQKADVNAQDNNKRTPLSYALTTKPVIMDTVKLLLQEKASPTIPDRAGETPIQIAAVLGLKKIVCLLLNYCNKLSDVAVIGVALDSALSVKQLGVANALIQQGASLHYLTKNNLDSKAHKILSFLQSAFRYIPFEIEFNYRMKILHNESMKHAAEKITSEIATKLPFEVSKIASSYLFEEKTLLEAFPKNKMLSFNAHLLAQKRPHQPSKKSALKRRRTV